MVCVWYGWLAGEGATLIAAISPGHPGEFVKMTCSRSIVTNSDVAAHLFPSSFTSYSHLAIPVSPQTLKLDLDFWICLLDLRHR